ncbi:MAG: dihydroorotase, partial [Helicobacter sp.]|nr:dihydroorotase [Helicobacter sp.]
ILLPALAQTFETHSALENLQDFVSFNASRIYNLPLGDKNITLIKKPMEIPKQCQGIIPMFAGETLTWSIE